MTERCLKCHKTCKGDLVYLKIDTGVVTYCSIHCLQQVIDNSKEYFVTRREDQIVEKDRLSSQCSDCYQIKKKSVKVHDSWFGKFCSFQCFGEKLSLETPGGQGCPGVYYVRECK